MIGMLNGEQVDSKTFTVDTTLADARNLRESIRDHIGV